MCKSLLLSSYDGNDDDKNNDNLFIKKNIKTSTRFSLYFLGFLILFSRLGIHFQCGHISTEIFVKILLFPSDNCNLINLFTALNETCKS